MARESRSNGLVFGDRHTNPDASDSEDSDDNSDDLDCVPPPTGVTVADDDDAFVGNDDDSAGSDPPGVVDNPPGIE